MFALASNSEIANSPLPIMDAVIVRETVIPRLVGPPPYKFLHMRYFFDVCVTDTNVLGYWHNGGATVAYQLYPDRLVYSFAICSRNDLFNRRIGRKIAVGRIESRIYDEIPITSEANVSKLIEHTIKPRIYERADNGGTWASTFADEIVDGTVNPDIKLHLF